MWPATSVNGRAWPASASRASSASTRRASAGTRRPGRACSRRRSTARRGRAGGRRRSAAAARAGAGRRATARGRASRSPARCRGRSRPSTPSDEVAVGRAACPPGRCPAPRRCSAQRRSGASGTPLWRAISIAAASVARGPRRGVQRAHGRVHPDLAAGALGDRRRLAAVVDVGVRADDQPHVARPAGRPASSARSRCAIEPRLVHAGVDEHDPVARPRAPTRCSAGRPARAAAAAAARRRAAPARRGRPRAVGWACARRGTVTWRARCRAPPARRSL